MIYNAHPVTFGFIILCLFIAPLYLFATFVFSNACKKKGIIIALLWLFYGVMMTLVCLYRLTNELGEVGAIIVPLAWALPSIVLYFARDWVFEKPLSDRILVGLQLMRAVGVVFLIEVARGNIPGVFGYSAGFGDILTALVALYVLVRYRGGLSIPKYFLYLVIAVGGLDFIAALFFGITSSNTPLQLFAHDFTSNLIVFPTGMIPLFLVPYAIFYHTLSWLNLSKYHNSNLITQQV